ncbi:MAG: F0F1 ATP synthase subunit delta [Clostridia bacterium]|nr:F0F1 ATP synthase subunit delta [Clostridia bacterium]MBQ7788196.1 F0F1 ATP synthase subunit delta [Clostridia bacterium]
MEKHKGYASALFSLSIEKSNLDNIANEIKIIDDIFSSNPDYAVLISSPGVSKKERVELLKAAIKDNFSDEITSFLVLLCEKGEICEFSQCAEEFYKLYREAKKLSVAYITSAIELTENEKERIKKRLEAKTGKELTLECKVDKSILGGIIAQIDGKIYDGSLKHKLSDIKKVIEQ